MLDDEIARHALDKGHWPGRTAEEVKAMISEVRDGAQDQFDFGNGRRIFRKGGIILIEDGKGAGTIFRAGRAARQYFRAKVREELGLL